MFRMLHTRRSVCLAPRVVAHVDYYKSVTQEVHTNFEDSCVCRQQTSRELTRVYKRAAVSDCCEVHHGVVGFYSWPIIGSNYRDALRSASEVDLSVFLSFSFHFCLVICLLHQKKCTMILPRFLDMYHNISQKTWYPKSKEACY